jgi:hypothetical protein
MTTDRSRLWLGKTQGLPYRVIGASQRKWPAKYTAVEQPLGGRQAIFADDRAVHRNLTPNRTKAWFFSYFTVEGLSP